MIVLRNRSFFYFVVFIFSLLLVFLLPKGEDYSQYLHNFSTSNTKSFILDFISEILKALRFAPQLQIITISMFSLVFAVNSAILLEKLFGVNRIYFFAAIVIPNFGNDWLSHVRSNLAQIVVLFSVCAFIYYKRYFRFFLIAIIGPLVHIAAIAPLSVSIVYNLFLRRLAFALNISVLLLCFVTFYFSEYILSFLLELTQDPLLNFYFHNRLVPDLSTLAIIEKFVLSVAIFSLMKRFSDRQFQYFASLYFFGVMLFCLFSFDPNMAGRISKPFNYFGYVCLLLIFSKLKPQLSGKVLFIFFLGLKFLSSIGYLI